MLEVVAVALGGALGAVMRHFVFIASGHLFGLGFPFGTLIVNVVGSFAMGTLIETMAFAWPAPMHFRLFLVTGVLGAFTTFSTFSLDVAVLYESGRVSAAGGYILASVVLSILGLFAGLHAVRLVLGPG